MKNTIKIVFVIIATLVGAGFASGKEIFTFFFIYGKIGLLGILISSAIISFVIYKVFKICNANKIDTYQDFCDFIGNSDFINKSKLLRNNLTLANLLNNAVNIFLLITFYIMISGFSSLLKQEFCINQICGSMIIIILCYFAFMKNINGLINISNYLIPVLIFFIVYISLKNTNIIQNYNNIFNITNEAKPVYFQGIIKSVLYACYNCIILIPVLIPLRKKIQNNRCVILISTITLILLMILSYAVYNLLLQGNTNIYSLEMPIIGVVKNYGEIYKSVYIVIIGISIFTSAISTGYGFLNNCSVNKSKYKRNARLMCITAIFLSQISFSAMVNLLYPVLGIIGILEVVQLGTRP